MNLIELIFAILRNFVPIAPTRTAQLEAEATDWYKKVKADDQSHPLLKKLQAHGEQWYVQVGFAIAYLFLVRYVHDFVNPTETEEEDD